MSSSGRTRRPAPSIGSARTAAAPWPPAATAGHYQDMDSVGADMERRGKEAGSEEGEGEGRRGGGGGGKSNGTKTRRTKRTKRTRKMKRTTRTTRTHLFGRLSGPETHRHRHPAFVLQLRCQRRHLTLQAPGARQLSWMRFGKEAARTHCGCYVAGTDVAAEWAEIVRAMWQQVRIN